MAATLALLRQELRTCVFVYVRVFVHMRCVRLCACVCVKDHLYVNETPRSWDDRGNSRRLGRQSKGQEGVDGV